MRFGLRDLIFLLVLLGVPVASFWFVFRPQNTEIIQAKREIEHKEQMLNSLTKATEQTADLVKANEEIKRAIELIEARLPTTKEVEVILQQVAEIAVSNKLTLVKVKSEKPVQAAAYMEQPLTMQVTGRFEGFYSFLLDLERLDRITRMPDIKIERADKQDGLINANFTLSIYFESGAADGGKS